MVHLHHSIADYGPVQIPKGKVVGKKWKIVKKLGEGGCGSVYKVQDITNKTTYAALKAESNFVAGGTVLKLEVQILKRLAGRPHVPQLLHSGKKELYCYMVMTLLGDSLGSLQKKSGKISSVSTQTRVGINILFGVKQLHDIGFIHRDLKPANVAVGRADTPDARFFHLLDFGLAREFVVVGEDQKLQMRRPRSKALFRGTTRYCSINTHEKGEQGRVDDLWSVLYMLAEMRGNLPWCNLREKKDINEMKKRTQHETLLKNSPIQLVEFARHLDTLNYYSHPDYALLYGHLMEIMKAGKFKFVDPYDWEKKAYDKNEKKSAASVTVAPATLKTYSTGSSSLKVETPATGLAKLKSSLLKGTDDNPFPAEWFQTNPLGF